MYIRSVSLGDIKFGTHLGCLGTSFIKGEPGRLVVEVESATLKEQMPQEKHVPVNGHWQELLVHEIASLLLVKEELGGDF